MERYNPQSIEKQTLSQAATNSTNSLLDDFQIRTKLLLEKPNGNFLSPDFPIEGVCPLTQKEYGIDCCRMAKLNSKESPIPENILESSYNWISKFYSCFIFNDNSFNEKPWLTALAQLSDHILKRNKPRKAFALIQKAFNEAKPSQNMTDNQRIGVLTSISPFMPILSQYLLKTHGLQKESINNIIINSEQHKSVNLKIGNGGWYRQIVNKEAFHEDPTTELLKIKRVAKSVKNKSFSLQNFAGGIQIVFTK